MSMTIFSVRWSASTRFLCSAERRALYCLRDGYLVMDCAIDIGAVDRQTAEQEIANLFAIFEHRPSALVRANMR
jgi:hypothetical protein